MRSTHFVAWSVGLSVGKDRELRKEAEPTEVPFGEWTLVSPRNHASDGGADSQGKVHFFEGRCGLSLSVL